MFVVALCVATYFCSVVVEASRPYYGHDYPNLGALETTIHRVAGEAIFLKEKAAMAGLRKTNSNTSLSGVADELLALSDKNNLQYNTILPIKNALEFAYDRVGAVEVRLAAVVAVSERLTGGLDTLRDQQTELLDSNVQQDADLVEAHSTLQLAMAKLEDKLRARAAESIREVEVIEKAHNAFRDLRATRTCYETVVEVDMNDEIGEGTMENPFPSSNYFGGNVPTIMCGIQGTVTHRKHPGYTKAYSDDDREKLALTVDCKAFEDKVRVTAFDMSTNSERPHYGPQNEIAFVYVDVRACSYAAQSGP